MLASYEHPPAEFEVLDNFKDCDGLVWSDRFNQQFDPTLQSGRASERYGTANGCGRIRRLHLQLLCHST